MNTEINSTSNHTKIRFGVCKKIAGIFKSFSLTEKIVFLVFTAIFIISGIGVALKVNNYFLVNVPEAGGVIKEGIIGTPRFINPVIAISAADKDITSLVFAGLTRKTADGKIIPDLAEKYEISEDGLEYRFFLRDNLRFHDGEKLTADDVVFTIIKTQDPEIDSPKQSEWIGVTPNKINDLEIVFSLKQPYAPFLESTTLGILPKHLWENIPTGGFSLSSYNTEPVGAGPYMLDKISRDKTNIPESYTLVAFKKYALGKPFISKFVVKLANSETELIELFNKGEIDSFGGITAQTAKSLKDAGVNVLTSPLPRIFGLFFNQNESRILADSAVRRALDVSTPKSEIINNILSGFAITADSSIPSQLNTEKFLSGGESDNDSDNTNNPENTEMIQESGDIALAQEILEKNGWEKNADGIYEKEKDKQKSIFSISISTNNVPELVAVANLVADNWKKVGIDASVKVFEPGDLSQTIIRPRNFEVLLFGLAIHRYPDLYAFWHSSQRIDPGLNITNYANISVDKLVDDLRTLNDKEKVSKAVSDFNKNIADDRPAIFLYSPEYVYVLPQKIEGVRFNNITSGEDRFANVYEWFVETDKVWKIFN